MKRSGIKFHLVYLGEWGIQNCARYHTAGKNIYISSYIYQFKFYVHVVLARCRGSQKEKMPSSLQFRTTIHVRPWFTYGDCHDRERACLNFHAELKEKRRSEGVFNFVGLYTWTLLSQTYLVPAYSYSKRCAPVCIYTIPLYIYNHLSL